MKNILVSGLNGFVGTNFITYLHQFNYRISGLSRKNNDNNSVLSNNFKWDELYRLKEFDFNTIIHLAGKAHDLKKTNNDEAYFIVNTGLTKSLFDVFLQSDSETFIYFSSVKAVADRVDSILIEDVIPNPQTAYGKSKLKAEEYLLAQKLPAGKRLIILRPCMIHGPGNKGNLNLLYQFVRRGIPYPLAAFDNKRSFLSIDNLCFVLKRLIEDTSIPSGIYHLADDETLSTNELIRLMAVSQNKKAKIWSIPVQLIKMIARSGDFMHLPLNSERLEKLTESYVVSNQKIKLALGVDKMPVTAIKGIQETLESFKSSGN